MMKSYVWKKKDIYSLAILCAIVLIFLSFIASQLIHVTVPEILSTSQYVYKKITPRQYFGANVDMAQLLPGSDHYIQNSQKKDLIDIAHNLGMNIFRIDNSSRAFQTSAPSPVYTKQQWDTVLQKMNENGMSAIVLAETGTSDPALKSLDLNTAYLEFLDNYIIKLHVCNNPDVMAIDLGNEIVITPHNLDILQQAANEIRKACPNTKITLGGWRSIRPQPNTDGSTHYDYNDPLAGKELYPLVDFYSLHIYGYDRKNIEGQYPDAYILTTNYIKQVRSYSQNKPLFVEEFGSANGDAISDQGTLGSVALQARIYQGVLKALHDMDSDNVIGGTAYLLYPRSTRPETWNIIKNNGDTILPAATMFQEGALNMDLSASIPNNLILTLDNANSTNTVNTGDIVGLILRLSKSNNYSLSITGDTNAVVSTEPFVSGWQYGTYTAVLHAASSGTVVIQIKNKITKESIFKTTLIIQ